MTKEDIVKVIEKAKCPMLKGLPIASMNKQEIISVLEKAKCPELAKLV